MVHLEVPIVTLNSLVLVSLKFFCLPKAIFKYVEKKIQQPIKWHIHDNVFTLKKVKNYLRESIVNLFTVKWNITSLCNITLFISFLGTLSTNVASLRKGKIVIL